MNRIQHFSRLSVLLLLIVAALAWQLHARQARAEMVDRVVAVVNNDVITLSELDQEGHAVFQKIAADSSPEELQAKMAKAREEILDTLIDQRLIAQQAKTSHIRVTKKDIDKALADILKRNKMTKAQLLAKLAESGMDEASYRRTLKSQILQHRLIQADIGQKVVVTDNMILDYYDKHYTTRLPKGAYYLLQMGFNWRSPDGKPLTQAALYANRLDARDRAEKVHKLAQQGRDFATLARRYSDLPSAADGGDIGVFQLGDMATPMRNSVAKLKSGQISKVVETSDGYQFYKVIAIGDGSIFQKTPLASVKEKIRGILFNREMKKAYIKWVKNLKNQAYIQKL